MAENKSTGASAPSPATSVSDQLLEEAGITGASKSEKSPASEKTDPPPTDDSSKGKDADASKKDTAPPTDTPPAGDDDIPDELLMKYLEKRGVKAKSVDELKPKEELTDDQKREMQERKRGEAIEFGKKNNLFTQKQYDDYVKFEAKEKIEVVRQAFVANLMAKDKELKEKDAEEVFDEQFFTLEDAESSKFKYGQQQIDEQFEAIKRDKFASIMDAEKIYDGVQENMQKATTYKAQLENIFQKEFKVFTFKIGDQDISYPITSEHAELLSTIKNDYLTGQMMSALLDQTGKIETAALKEEIEKDLFWRLKDKIILEAAKSYADKAITDKTKGRKGVIQPDDPAADSDKKSTVKGKSDFLLEEAQKEGIL